MDELNSILEQCRDKSKQQEQDGVWLLLLFAWIFFYCLQFYENNK